MSAKIGVMGSAYVASDAAYRAACIIGREIAARGYVLVTGGTTGVPYEAAKGAKAENGMVVGISPAKDACEHVKVYKKPLDYVDVMIYTGLGFNGRNIINVRTSDALIFVAGEAGTLNEFTIAYYEGKVMGVLTGVGGVTDKLQDVCSGFETTYGSTVIYESDPCALVDKVATAIPNVAPSEFRAKNDWR